MADVTETPQETLEAATEDNVFPRRGLALLGTFLKTGGAEALVRTPSGNIESIMEGDRIDGARVMAIGEGEVVLARGGSATRLRMPGG
ncbi:pilus assembly protein PilP [Roseovarius aestuariivivens]|uniref:pilus assembly protein PilP n=1 Tax=Roseovarius aestuariivivens TaxID=1888910 RepID=UPI001FDA99DA|nr:pilus assembly protein PilP [Roseovarius aestuariivivens]